MCDISPSGVSWQVEIINLPKPSSNTFLQNFEMLIPASSTNLPEPIFLPQPLLVPLYNLDAFLPEEEMMREGETPFVFSGQQLLFSLSTSFSLLGPPEHPRLVPSFAHTPCSFQTQVDARGRGKTADAGQSRALERPAGHRPLTPRLSTTSSFPRAPVDAPRRPLHASRLPTCSRALLSLLQLAPERRPARPMLVPLLWPVCSSPRSSSLFLVPHPTPTNAIDSPSPSLLASRAVAAATRRPRPW